MKTITLVLSVLLMTLLLSCSENQTPNNVKVIYGNNSSSGKYINIDSSKVYFETYGDSNKPALVLIHGNGGSIAAMELQIEYFKENYFVIIGDNRTHGKSGDAEKLTYHLMAKDYINILDTLNISSALVLGQSDGGIIGLIMAIEYPDRVEKLVAAVPNIVTGEEAIVSWELEMGKEYRKLIDSMLQAGDQSRDWKREKVHMDLMKNEPNLALTELNKIQCPVLVMTSDDDLIKPRHILDIYENIPNAQLFVMPGATHFMIRDEHEFFNSVANKFLESPFERPRSKEVLMKLIGLEE